MTPKQPAYGEVWVYALSDTLAIRLDPDASLHALAVAVGVQKLNTADVQIIAPETLSDLGLRNFLEMGYGITSDQTARIAQDTPSQTIAILRFGAFEGISQSPVPTADASLLGIFTEANATAPSLSPLASDAAKGAITPKTKPAKSDARIGGMIATVALLLMFALVALMIWVGG